MISEFTTIYSNLKDHHEFDWGIIYKRWWNKSINQSEDIPNVISNVPRYCLNKPKLVFKTN